VYDCRKDELMLGMDQVGLVFTEECQGVMAVT